MARTSFDITPYLHPDDPWVKHDGLEFVKRIYDEKHRLAQLLQPGSIVEIGVRAGYTAAAFLAANPEATYLGFDIDGPLHGGWEGSCRWAEQNLKKHFPKANIEVRIADSQKLLALPSGPVDLINVDGDHSYDGAMHDLVLAERLNPKWILLDDVTFDKHVCRAAHDFVKLGGWQWVLFPTVRGDLLIQRSEWLK